MEPTTEQSTHTTRVTLDFDINKDNVQATLSNILNACGVQSTDDTAQQLSITCSAEHGGNLKLQTLQPISNLQLSVHTPEDAELVSRIKTCPRFFNRVPEGQEEQWIEALLQLQALGYNRWKPCLNTMIKTGYTGNLQQLINDMDEHKAWRLQKREEKRDLKRKRFSDDKGHKHRKHKREDKRRKKQFDEMDTNDNESSDSEEPYQFPQDVTHLLLDANNMAFITKTLRNKFIRGGRGGKKQVEDAFYQMAKQFAMVHPNLRNVTVLFDGKCTQRTETLQNGAVISLLGCMPHYKIADDALVAWAERNSALCPSALVATSDRELRERLTEAGVKYLLKSGQWMKCALKDVAGDKMSLDEWTATFIKD